MRPAGTLVIASRCVVVIRGGKNPCVVLVRSIKAFVLGEVVPMAKVLPMKSATTVIVPPITFAINVLP